MIGKNRNWLKCPYKKHLEMARNGDDNDDDLDNADDKDSNREALFQF